MSHFLRTAGTSGLAVAGRSLVLTGTAFAVALCLAGRPVLAQETAAAPHLLLELNDLQPSERGCRLTFLAVNRLGGELASAAFELALFDKAGALSRLTIIAFKDLPQDKTKVRQFDFAGIDCADVGRILVNDATECAGEGIESKACIRGLRAQSRSDDVAFGI